MAAKVLVASKIHPVIIELLGEKGLSFVFIEVLGGRVDLTKMGEIEGIITSNTMAVGRDIIDAAPRLKWIGRLGSGMEIIDVSYAVSKGIRCFSSPSGNANAVAEQALGMLLSLSHKITAAHREMQAGIWQREPNRGWEIAGKTAAVIGYGSNGSLFAKKLLALGLKVLVYDPYKQPEDIAGIRFCSDLMLINQEADIISFHVPLTEETRHYFNLQMLAAFSKPVVLLNLSRGEVVDTFAALEGLQSGKIRAAAFDVWEREPVSSGSTDFREAVRSLLSLPNFIGTPHIAGYTQEALYKMSKLLADRVIDTFYA